MENPKKNRKLETHEKIGNRKSYKKKGNRKTQTHKIDPRKFRSSARKRRLGIVGIGVIGRCALKISGRFEVSYIPPGAGDMYLTRAVFCFCVSLSLPLC